MLSHLNGMSLWPQGSRSSSLEDESTGLCRVCSSPGVPFVGSSLWNSEFPLGSASFSTNFQLNLYAMAVLKIDRFLKHLQLLSKNSIRFCFVF